MIGRPATTEPALDHNVPSAFRYRTTKSDYKLWQSFGNIRQRVALRLIGYTEEEAMNGLIYLVGLVVVVLAVLSFFGLR